MLDVLWEIIIPLLLASWIGLFIGWLLWRRRKARVTKVEWDQAQRRTADAERNAAVLSSANTVLSSANVDLDARASTLDVELESVRRHRDRVVTEHEEVSARLNSTLSSLSVSIGRAGELEDALATARSRLRGFASMPGMLAAAQARVSELETDLEAANDRIAGLETELITAHGPFEELEDEVSDASDELLGCAPLPGPLEVEPSRRLGLGDELAEALTKMVKLERELAESRSVTMSFGQPSNTSENDASELECFLERARNGAESLARVQAAYRPDEELTTTD